MASFWASETCSQIIVIILSARHAASKIVWIEQADACLQNGLQRRGTAQKHSLKSRISCSSAKNCQSSLCNVSHLSGEGSQPVATPCCISGYAKMEVLTGCQASSIQSLLKGFVRDSGRGTTVPSCNHQEDDEFRA